MPATPMEAFFLTEEEKYHMVRRVADNKTGIENKSWKWDQVKEAMVDPKTWLLFFFNVRSLHHFLVNKILIQNRLLLTSQMAALQPSTAS